MNNDQYYVYIMSNKRNTAIYTGVTKNLKRRASEHRNSYKGFTKMYNVNKLVYYEIIDSIDRAVLREKQIKAGSRRKKLELINKINREWRDLYEEL